MEEIYTWLGSPPTPLYRHQRAGCLRVLHCRFIYQMSPKNRQNNTPIVPNRRTSGAESSVANHCGSRTNIPAGTGEKAGIRSTVCIIKGGSTRAGIVTISISCQIGGKIVEFAPLFCFL